MMRCLRQAVEFDLAFALSPLPGIV